MPGERAGSAIGLRWGRGSWGRALEAGGVEGFDEGDPEVGEENSSSGGGEVQALFWQDHEDLVSKKKKKKDHEDSGRLRGCSEERLVDGCSDWSDWRAINKGDRVGFEADQEIWFQAHKEFQADIDAMDIDRFDSERDWRFQAVPAAAVFHWDRFLSWD